MALPREEILQAIKSTLEGITTANDYTLQMKTVSVGYEMPAKRLRSEYPMAIVAPLADIDSSETFGAQTANRYHREWGVAIVAAFWPESNTDRRAKGEELLTAVVKALTASKTFGLTPSSYTLTFDLDELLDADDFEIDESGLVRVGVNLKVRYSFTNATI